MASKGVRTVAGTQRGIEVVTESRRMTIVNGQLESMPADPHEVAKTLRARRARRTPGGRLRSKIASDFKRRGFA
ncbi:MAG: hypothetical protein EON59_12080 [Alphaproteobacteria bacterium]|nr:MAG: hypothetical protein EON59_12080 [Alphaproteobacteria bacterium]